MTDESRAIAQELFRSIGDIVGSSKRMKVRSLLRKFGYEKRSDTNTAAITEVLHTAGVAINPAIIRLGADWQIDLDDWIFLAREDAVASEQAAIAESVLPPNWNADGWFDRLGELNLRTEKEVEIKFIVPLLFRLGYLEEDRYDGMTCHANEGSKKTTYIADFALHNVSEAALKGCVLLIAEAKKEDKLKRPTEIQNAFRQAKSYAVWTGCRHLLVTDGRQIHAYEVLRNGVADDAPVFTCQRNELVNAFGQLYSIVSKNALTRYHMKFVAALEEAR